MNTRPSLNPQMVFQVKKGEMKMKEYNTPEITLIIIDSDIITQSVGDYGDTDTPPTELDW